MTLPGWSPGWRGGGGRKAAVAGGGGGGIEWGPGPSAPISGCGRGRGGAGRRRRGGPRSGPRGPPCGDPDRPGPDARRPWWQLPGVREAAPCSPWRRGRGRCLPGRPRGPGARASGGGTMNGPAVPGPAEVAPLARPSRALAPRLAPAPGPGLPPWPRAWEGGLGSTLPGSIWEASGNPPHTAGHKR